MDAVVTQIKQQIIKLGYIVVLQTAGRSATYNPQQYGVIYSEFPAGDFRKNDFAGDRVARAVKRVEQIETDIAESGLTQPQAALRFALAHTVVRTIIAGIRSVQQTEANGAASDLPPLRRNCYRNCTSVLGCAASGI